MRIIQKPSCFVTGCAGNVGSHLTATLLRANCIVTGIDNFFSGTPDNMQDFTMNPNFYFYQGSITDSHLLDTIFAKHGPFSTVFHLAAIISVPYSMDHADETMRINHEASLALHSRARKNGQGTFVFAGSAAEYGRPLARPAREADAGDPVSPYGVSKHLVSRAIEDSGYGAALRFFNIYGPTRAKPGPYDGVVRLFLNRAERGRAPVVLGDGGQVRDFLFLRDAVEALMRAAGLKGGRPLSGIYNVGTGKGTSIMQLAHHVRTLYGLTEDIGSGPERPGDIRFSVADAGKLLAATGWMPGTLMERGLPRTVEGMRRLGVAAG